MPSDEISLTDIGKKHDAHFRRLEERQSAHFRRIEKAWGEFEKVLKAHEKIMREISRKQDMLDETVGNVLLAIRQNEYLQAWYPAQHGFADGHVTGVHPAKLVKTKKEQI